MSNKIDLEIDGFKILKEISSGGMGTVYKAYHVLLEQIVAIKVARKEDAQLEERLQREVQLSFTLKHDNVVQYRNLGRTTDGRSYVVMDYIDGMNLRDKIKSERSIDYGTCLLILKDVLRGLQGIHSTGNIHRDISPMNIMIEHRHPLPPRAVLIDLGLSKSVSSAVVPKAPLTLAGDFVGNPSYAAPEQWLQDSRWSVDRRTDIFSLGMVAFEMLTGVAPMKLQSKDRTSYPKLLTFEECDTTNKVPPRLREIIERSLRENPEERFQDVHDFLEAINAIPDPNASTHEFETDQRYGGSKKGIQEVAAGDAQIGDEPKEGRITLSLNFWRLCVGVLAAVVLFLIIYIIGGDAGVSPDPNKVDGSSDDGPQPGEMENPIPVYISGSNTIGSSLMADLLKKYADVNGYEVLDSDTNQSHLDMVIFKKRVRFEIFPGGSGMAASGLLGEEAAFEGQRATLGMMSREPKPEEIEALRDRRIIGNKSKSFAVVGFDAVAVIVNEKNPLESLPLCDVADIFTGNTTHWDSLFWPGSGSISIYSRDGKSGTTHVFLREIVEACNLRAADATLSSGLDSREVVSKVAEDLYGIGFVGAGYLRGQVGVKPIGLSRCGADYSLTTFSIVSGDYPLSRPLYVVLPEETFMEEGLHRQFVGDFSRFLSGESSRDNVLPELSETLNAHGFFGLKVQPGYSAERYFRERRRENGGANERNLFRQLQDFIQESRRLSTTFRYPYGVESLEFDERLRSDISQLHSYLNSQLSEDTSYDLLFVGFADSIGDFSGNLEASKSRAEQALADVAPGLGGKNVELDFMGAGHIMPIVCMEGRRNQQDEAAQRMLSRNRRVEIWLRERGAAR